MSDAASGRAASRLPDDAAPADRAPQIESSSADLKPSWREQLAPYARPDTGGARCCAWRPRSLPTSACRSPCTSCSGVSDLLALLLVLPAAAFLVRTFIVFHDCTHGSFFALPAGQRVARDRSIGPAALLAVPALAPRPRRPPRDLGRPRPPRHRRRPHADRRRVPTRCRARGRLGYRLMRNPLVMFGIGPIVAMIIGPRIVARKRAPDAPQRARHRRGARRDRRAARAG